MKTTSLLLLLLSGMLYPMAGFAQLPADSTATAEEQRETALMRELCEDCETRPQGDALLWTARFDGADEIRTAEELYRKVRTILHDTWRSTASDEILAQDDDHLRAHMLFSHIISGHRFGYAFDCRVRMLRDEAAAEVELRCTELQFDDQTKRPADSFPFRDEAEEPFAVKKREFAQWLQLESALRTLHYSLQFELAGGL